MAQKLKFGNGTWATKEGSTLAYNDENENYKPLPFNFERDSIATRVNKEGLIEVVGNDVPRIDYTNSADGALLLEPQRTNLITYSEGFDNWQKSSTNIITSNVVSPSGQSNAKKIITNNATNQAYANTTATVTQNATYTFSCFAKKGEVRFICLVGLNPVTFSYFDLELGVKGTSTVTSKMEDYGNGWYRCSATFTADTTSKFCGIYLTPVDNSLSASSIPNGDGNHIFGAQLEQGSYATSYIPTQGSSVTRAAETANGSGNSEVFNDSEGVLYGVISAFADNIYKRISLNNGSYLQSVVFDFDNNNNLLGKIFVGGSNVVNIPTLGLDIENNNKIAFKYKASDFALWVNGFELGTSNINSIPSGLDKVDLSLAGDQDFYGKTKEIGVYDIALTDAELETLTSYRSLSELVTELNLNTL